MQQLSILPQYIRLDIYEGDSFPFGVQFFEEDGTTEKDISAYAKIRLQAREGRQDATADVDIVGAVMESDAGIKSVMTIPFTHASTFDKPTNRVLTYDVSYTDETGTEKTAIYGSMLIRPRSTL